ncbi:hypothetical protein PHG31p72 [Aeromonas phage 31]|uniref:Uncharacterized protein PHG31ORF073c n=1 Tax=Aeromonas phage 31 TaxID=321023 RepID=Q56ET9_9CAUD|nr:hypothetical protein PHG31p72 [Aeromonas phage 31]AAX63561.1 hypothetical protein PHG31p72 [Aeromonas phage 31]
MTKHKDLNRFLKNTHDTTGNKYRKSRDLNSRFADKHHFMRLLNNLLPSEMKWSSFGSRFGIAKISPNHINLAAVGTHSVCGTIWVNTSFESDCVTNRLQTLEAYGVFVEVARRTNGSNHVVTFSVDLPNGDKAPVKNVETKTEVVSTVDYTEPAKEPDGQNIFFAPETMRAVQLVRGVFHFASVRISEIDEEIKELQARRKEIEDNIKSIKNAIGA